MEPEGSLPQSQVPATCPYPEPAQLGCTKVTARVQGLLFDCFATRYVFTARSY